MLHNHIPTIALLSALATRCCSAQDSFPAAASRTNTFNASYGPLNPDQALDIIRTANLSEAQEEAVLVAVNFERSNWAGSSAQLDPFYTNIPANASGGSVAAGGTPLKIEQRTNTSLYTLPPGVALSRMLFTTETLNGSVVPASAYVLWPWQARRFKNAATAGNYTTDGGAPIVGWAHGSSGWSAECGPSHIRNLWYQYSGPFTLALQGYVVVAPDYAGLGVGHDAAGNFIAHQYGANPAHGNDLVFAVEAARKAWSAKLGGSKFALAGHSQGGGAAWGAAERLAKHPVEGYLGTVAASPSVSIADVAKLAADDPLIGGGLAKLATGLSSIFPDFQWSDWLSDQGIRTTAALQKLQGCQSVGLEIHANPGLARDGWNETYYLDAFDRLTRSGGKEFAGPMLVLQGSADANAPAVLTTAAINQTCAALPGSKLQYTLLDGVGHVPVMFAGQQIWLDWIADRFNGVEVSEGCTSETLEADLEVEAYQVDMGYTLQYALYPYEIA